MPTPKQKRQLTNWQVLRQVERTFHSWESNRQPFPRDLGISPPSSSSLGSSRTNVGGLLTDVNGKSFPKVGQGSFA